MDKMTRYNPISGMVPLSEAMDRLMRDALTWPSLLDRSSGSTQTPAWSNLFENDGAYLLQVALPGVSTDSLAVTAQQNQLIVKGSFATMVPEGATSIWATLPAGEFGFQFSLPGEVDAGQASADYRDGILMLTLPKAQHLRPHTIKINSPASSDK